MGGLGEDQVVAGFGQEQRAARVVRSEVDTGIRERVEVALRGDGSVRANDFGFELDDVDVLDVRGDRLQRQTPAEADQ